MNYSVFDLHSDFPDDDACLEWLVNYRWPEGITCKVCMVVTKHHKLKTRRAYCCDRCGHQVYPTAGTIFHQSTTPLTKWFHALYLMSTNKAGTSAKQIERELGVSYPTAWRIMHQIRSLMTEDKAPLSGEVEIDETFMHANSFKRSSARRRYGYDVRRKGLVVLGMTERGTHRTKVWHVPTSKSPDIMPIIYANIKPGSTVYTDGYLAYRPLTDKGFDHQWTQHGAEQYVDGDNHTQNIENVWGGFKRGIKGVYRNVDKKYLQNYAQEYAWRYSKRDSISMFWALMDEVSPPSEEA